MAGLESLALKFVAHHLWDPARRETDPQHGMPAEVATQLRDAACFCAATARMRHRRSSGGWRAGAPCIAGKGRRVRSARPVCAPRSGSRSAPARGRGSARASGRSPATCSIVCSATCRSDRLADTRDLAILLLAVRLRRTTAQRGRAAAGRAAQRRTAGPARSPGPEIAGLCRVVAIQLGRTKTGHADEAGRVLLVGAAGRGAARMARAGRHQPRGRSSGPSTAGRR